MSEAQNYEEVSKAAKARRDDALRNEHGLSETQIDKAGKNLVEYVKSSAGFSDAELAIIGSTPRAILEKIHSKEWSASTVLEAFIKSATVAQQLTNCITEVLFTEARQRAKELDEHLSKTGKPIGPFHGLPISLKDCFITPPHPSSIGMAAHAAADTSKDMESTIVSIVRDLGAVAYVKTNTPTGMMMMETTNNVWGTARNAIHSGCSPGGSSGGEGAIIALLGSPLGIGTDIGGSIRIPSAFSELYGLKPSFSRFPTQGTRSGIPGQEFIFSVNGPMARDLDSLSLYSSAVLSNSPAASPWLKDPKCIPIPWRSGPHIQPAGRKLRFGIMPGNDGIAQVHPPIDRALQVTRSALEAAGHEVMEWAPEKHTEMIELVFQAFGGFGASAMLPLLQKCNEPIFPSMSAYESVIGMKDSIMGPDHYREAVLRRNALQKKLLDRWQGTADAAGGKGPIDGLICPTSVWSACRLGVTQNGPTGLSNVSFTAVWSLMDVPVCVFPVTRVDKTLDKKREQFSPLSDLDKRLQEDYDPDFYDGSPVGLQLVGERLGEEKLLEVTEHVVAALKKADVK